MQVLKFGGSSVATAENIRKVQSIVKAENVKQQLIVVVSALGGTTDLLLEIAGQAAQGDERYLEKIKIVEQRHLELVRSLLPFQAQSALLSRVKKMINELEKTCEGIFLLRELTLRAKDLVAGFGELLSSRIISAYLGEEGMDQLWIDSRELIRTDSNFGMGEVNYTTTNMLIRKAFEVDRHRVYILPGFIASDAEGTPTTLGRGGSDYSAAILASALKAGLLEIWTDVDGLMTADPRLVKDARSISCITYPEAMELSHFGARVIYPPTLKPVMDANIPVRIRNTFSPEKDGTLISDVGELPESIFRGISSISKVALLTLKGSGMVGVHGISARLFQALSDTGVNAIFITQCSSEQSITVAIDSEHSADAKKAVDEMFRFERSNGKVDAVLLDHGLAIIALVGDKMKDHPGISGRMFSMLGRNGINICAIAQGSSERNITAIISQEDLKNALNVLHEEFFENKRRQINLFIAGLGNVGSRLMDQLGKQQQHLREQLNIDLRIRGLINSRQMIIQDEDIEPSCWKEELAKGQAADLNVFLNSVRARRLRNTVFIDITASAQVAECYESLLKHSISVVACNKIACSSLYQRYRALKETARNYQVSFLYETNVGAGLPVIGTLNDLIRSGDSVNKMEAVLSGTLNFVFNTYDTTRSFASVVRQAQQEGYTEPDPRTDLTGLDVMRKILILVRESGQAMEQQQIQNTTFLPASCLKGDVENFYRELEKEETWFRELYHSASEKKCKLRFVACFESGKASVGLQQVTADNDLYHLNGKDNVVVFRTSRYHFQPLVIKGAGAGAEVTASGIFGDIIRAGNMQ
ncbi:MAG: bifunctional aspartate kinase/homoserine dehydrogenase I [Bacteroidia bacterium]